MYEPSAGQIRQADEDCEAEFGGGAADDEEVSSIFDGASVGDDEEVSMMIAVIVFNAWRLYETETRGAAHFESIVRSQKDSKHSILLFLARVRSRELADPLFVKLFSKCAFDAQGIPTFDTVESSRMARECAAELDQRVVRACATKAATAVEENE
jgi:hypothetical protein